MICRPLKPLLAILFTATLLLQGVARAQCVVPDNGGGTVTLPPAGCDYLSPDDVHEIINGLPPGTTIQVAAIHRDFICSHGDATGQSVCSFPPPIPGVDCDQPGGTLGGDEECADSNLSLSLTGTGMLSGYDRVLTLPVQMETHTGPRTPGSSVQSFNTDMYRMMGQITGDPDFDLLRITAGTNFGMPSPGHTTLRQQPGGNWAVDSFFDIEYRIDFVGRPGGPQGGMSGSTTGTIRMTTAGEPCPHGNVDCNDGNPCTNDRCVPQGCVGPDDGTGTATLPPQGCGYVSPEDVHKIIAGLPPGTTLEVGAQHAGFLNIVNGPGGTLGGEKETFNSLLDLHLSGTGMLAGYNRTLGVQVACETHIGPRTHGNPVQSFDTLMFRLQGQITGDPDFDLLRITGGNAFGMPSPGHTTLTRQAGGNWAIDSFFDISYRIDFIGHAPGPFGGMSGSTTGTIRMKATSGAQCVHDPLNCDDNNPCTIDGCDPLTGQCVHQSNCDDGDPCTTDTCDPTEGTSTDPCVVTDNGSGTVTLPPAGCDYLSPDQVHRITAGLPPGTTIELGAIHRDFICNRQPGAAGVCSFVPGVDCDEPGGALGGEKECADSNLALTLAGTGMLAGFSRNITLPMSFEVHTAPRTPGSPVQSFNTEMFRMQGQLPPGDPDFDLLRITAGNDFGLPSPGHTTLVRQSGGQWSVDSFFDIEYRIDFVGHPGGHVSGMSGSTTATIRMSTGGVGCVHDPVNCDDGNPCTVDRCDSETGQCVHTPVDCSDGNACTADHCDPVSGQCLHDPLNCDDGNPCTIDGCTQFEGTANPCIVTDNGSGTVTLPPAGCDYLSPDDVHEIIDGLPPATTIELGAIHKDFICRGGSAGGGVCSFQSPPPGVDCDEPGGDLGGEKECSDSNLALTMTGTGMLAGFNRTMSLPMSFEVHTAPRTPGDPVQSFDTEMYRMLGQLPPGDPDFDLLRITAGTNFGLPSPGHTTLVRQPGGSWAVDSFFDIEYRIDFVGHPGGRLGGRSGSTTGTIRMSTGHGGCTHQPVDCNDNNPCTVDRCDPQTGNCVHSPVDCGDGNACTADICDPATGKCLHEPLNCNDNNPCTIDGCTPLEGTGTPPCVVPDNGGGTVTLPPAGCNYLSPDDVHEIIDGLPPGTTVQLGAIHRDFICHRQPGGAGVCSFPIGVDCDEPGGALGGEKECADSSLALTLTGTGMLDGYSRTMNLPMSFEVHTAPRTPGTPVQSFDTEMFRMFGQITGDPDFDLLRITAGNDFGLPSPGHTTLRRQPGGSWAVDSFFDIEYRIDFVGRAGGRFGGMSGSTTGTIRMSTGHGGCTHQQVDCNDNNPCTLDSCNPATGQCVHVLVPASEVGTIKFVNKTTLVWPPTQDATHWNTYRGSIPENTLGRRLPGSPYDQTCFESADAQGNGPTTSVDTARPPTATAYYYLVSGESTCGESALGHRSSGAAIPNSSPCPTPP